MTRRIDTHHRKTDELIDWSVARRYPEVVELTERLGYHVDAYDPRKLDERYLGRLNQAVNRVRRAMRSFVPA